MLVQLEWVDGVADDKQEEANKSSLIAHISEKNYEYMICVLNTGEINSQCFYVSVRKWIVGLIIEPLVYTKNKTGGSFKWIIPLMTKGVIYY